MKYILTVTVVGHQDPECNIYTLQQELDFGIEEPTAEQIKFACKQVKQQYLDSWPHRRQSKPSILPVTATVRDIHLYDDDDIKGVTTQLARKTVAA